MTYTLSQIIDKRTINKARRDFDFGYKNELKVMEGVFTWCHARDISCEYQKIDETEAFNDGKVHTTPDFYLSINGKHMTYEVKCSTTDGFTNRDNEEYIFVKPYAIWTMINDPNKYPDGKLIVATKRKFAILPAKDVQTYPLEDIPEWGGKQAYVIPADKLNWNAWVVTLDL